MKFNIHINHTCNNVLSTSAEQEKERRKREIELENIRLQLEHLRQYPLVETAEKDGSIQLHGLFYNLETGELSKIA